MAKLLKLRRGSTSGHSSFTGAEGEVTIDTTKDTAVVHDGSTAGGRPLAREDLNNVTSATIAGKLAADSLTTSKLAAGALPTDVTVASANIVDGSIVNADVNASAAIAGTKISPDFGSQDIVTTGKLLIDDNIDMPDGAKVIIGTGDDLQIYHDGSHSYIQDQTGQGQLVIATDGLRVNSADNSDNMITADQLGAVKLYHADSKKFETTSYGAAVSGILASTGDIKITNDTGKFVSGASDDLQIYHDGSNSRINNTTGKLMLKDDLIEFVRQADDSVSFKVDEGGATELYHNHNKKLETASGGVNVTGALVASGNVTAFSDSRLKTEIHTIKDPLEKVDRLRGVTFKWLHTDKPSSGVIAQEVQEVFPELVEATTHEGKEVLSVDYGKLVGVLIESIKELKAEFEAHKAECAKQHGGE